MPICSDLFLYVTALKAAQLKLIFRLLEMCSGGIALNKFQYLMAKVPAPRFVVAVALLCPGKYWHLTYSCSRAGM